MNYGFIQSKLDGTEYQYSAPISVEMPKEYSYVKFMPSVLNQGNMPICVPCSISAHINWKENLKNDLAEEKDVNVDILSIYNQRENQNSEGMSFKDALKYLRHHGVQTNNGLFKIDKYAMVGGIEQMKSALVMNGPCIGGLPCFNTSITEFWKNNGRFNGGHAIAIVGYTEDGFIIRNSWGEGYGNNGYSILRYKDFNAIMEAWTIL